MEPIRRSNRCQGTRLLVLATVALAAAMLGATAAEARGCRPLHGCADVLRVGTWHGIKGQFQSIQDAVDAAHPGDWVLVGPGDYHERADYSHRHHAPSDEAGAAVFIGKDDLHLRGMNRNQVIVDGTQRGSKPCSSRLEDQDFGPPGRGGMRVGRNGIVVYKANGVTIDNLTACNFLGPGNDATQVWWNGGDGSGKIGMGSWYGSYLSATSTFYRANRKQPGYGLFASNSRGPGRFTHTYASNMNDAGVYIGACRRICHAVVTKSRFEYNALGYSGTNAGGELVLKKSVWNHNATGIVTNSQNNDDAPSPQDGACPKGGTGPTGTYSCTFIEDNRIRNDNNNHTPIASTVPAVIGSGIVISGGRDDTVMNNAVRHQGAWGILLAPWPDLGPPPPIAHCQGGTPDALGPGTCVYDDWGNQVHHNLLSGNGFFGNPTNGDLAELSDPEPSENSNCWYANKHPDGSPASSTPSDLQTKHGKAACGQPQTSGGEPVFSSGDHTLFDQTACDARVFGPCPPSPGMSYPQPGKVHMHKLPRQDSMPNPCRGVPANPWCPGRGSASGRSRGY